MLEHHTAFIKPLSVTLRYRKSRKLTSWLSEFTIYSKRQQQTENHSSKLQSTEYKIVVLLHVEYLSLQAHSSDLNGVEPALLQAVNLKEGWV